MECITLFVLNAGLLRMVLVYICYLAGGLGNSVALPFGIGAEEMPEMMIEVSYVRESLPTTKSTENMVPSVGSLRLFRTCNLLESAV